MGKPGDRGIPLFIQRIIDTGLVRDLPDIRDTLFVNGITCFLYKTEIIGIDPHRIPVCHVLKKVFVFIRFNGCRQILRGSDALRKDRFP